MRAAALLLVLGACTEPDVLRVRVGHDYAYAELVDRSCDCRYLPRIPLGECHVPSDTPGLGCPCAFDPGPCDDITAEHLGDGPSVRISGCGEQFDLMIATTYPAAPAVWATPLSEGTRITWQVDATAPAVRYEEPGTLGGPICMFRPEHNTRELNAYPRVLIEVSALAEPLILDTPLGLALISVENRTTIDPRTPSQKLLSHGPLPPSCDRVP